MAKRKTAITQTSVNMMSGGLVSLNDMDILYKCWQAKTFHEAVIYHVQERIWATERMMRMVLAVYQDGLIGMGKFLATQDGAKIQNDKSRKLDRTNLSLAHPTKTKDQLNALSPDTPLSEMQHIHGAHTFGCHIFFPDLSSAGADDPVHFFQNTFNATLGSIRPMPAALNTGPERAIDNWQLEFIGEVIKGIATGALDSNEKLSAALQGEIAGGRLQKMILERCGGVEGYVSAAWCLDAIKALQSDWSDLLEEISTHELTDATEVGAGSSETAGGGAGGTSKGDY